MTSENGLKKPQEDYMTIATCDYWDKPIKTGDHMAIDNQLYYHGDCWVRLNETYPHVKESGDEAKNCGQASQDSTQSCCGR